MEAAMEHHSTISLNALRNTSIQVILDNQHPGGAYPAAVNYAVYNYSWFRDGAFVAEAMSRVGEADSASAFHSWCHRTLLNRADHIAALIGRANNGGGVEADELLPTRYTLEGEAGTDDWWDFQLDGYGTWLWAAHQHIARHALDPSTVAESVDLAARYLLSFGHLACYDWWEEFREHRHTSTIASVAAGLGAARQILDAGHELNDQLDTRIDELETELATTIDAAGSLTKWYGSALVDGSLLATFAPFGVIEPGTDTAEATYHRISDELATNGGVYRYLGDTFYGGGEWINLTALLGMYEAATGRISQATERLEWIAAQATENGELPEQVSLNTQAPDRITEWVDRWGPVATPLLWSHAMFLILDDELGPTW